MTEKRLGDVPPASSDAIRQRMSRQAKRDTECEKAIRSQLYAAGMRYRVHYPVPGRTRRRIDIAFPAKRVAVFVDGCFWHGCPVHGHAIRSNAGWWTRKIARNRERDEETDGVLRDAGWEVVRIWEHERPEDAANRIIRQVKAMGD